MKPSYDADIVKVFYNYKEIPLSEDLTEPLNEQTALLGELETNINSLTNISDIKNKYFVKVIDYDDTVLKEANLNTNDTFILPDAPSHYGLVFKGWSLSCPLEIIDNTITSGEDSVIVRATYDTLNPVLTNWSGRYDSNLDGLVLTNYSGAETDIVIPRELDTATLVSYDNSQAAPATTLPVVGVEGNLQALTPLVTNFYSITSIHIPNSVKYIGDITFGFSGCTNVNDVIAGVSEPIYNGGINVVFEINTILQQMGVAAFGLSGINKINLPSGQYEFSSFEFNDTAVGTFWFCSNLIDITIPDNVTDIGESVFQNCSNLTNVIIGNGVKTIGSHAFAACINLTKAVVGDGVTDIGTYAFAYCYELTDITIGNSVKTIGATAFYGCPITRVDISSLENWLKIDFSSYPLRSEAGLYLNGNLVTSVVIPNTISEIKPYVFAYYTSLTSVTIPNSITSIGSHAFFMCEGLTGDLIIPDSVTVIGEDAFSYCSSLANISISENVTSIGSSAFSNCSSLTSISIPSGVTNIANNTFNNCSSITIYDFSKCTKVPTLQNTDAFYNINATASIVVPDALYNEWIAASRWVAFANYIHKASEVINE